MVDIELSPGLESLLPTSLKPVPVVDSISEADLRKTARKAGTPVLLKKATDSWSALRSWRDPQRMLDLVGADTEVFCRQVRDPGSDWSEDYKPIRFGDLVHEVFEVGASNHYLTQALIFPPEGLLRRVVRAVYPALLQKLAVDVAIPEMVPREELHEGVMWLGAGGQVTQLHFDDLDNVNCVVRGHKRWVLFPPSERKRLVLKGEKLRGAMLSSLERLTEGGTWRGGTVQEAYTCTTGPGDSLFVPAGFAHQVYSSSEPSIAINFWFHDIGSPRAFARLVRDRSLRRTGFEDPLGRALWSTRFTARVAAFLVAYRLRPSSVPIPELRLGASSYDAAAGL